MGETGKTRCLRSPLSQPRLAPARGLVLIIVSENGKHGGTGLFTLDRELQQVSTVVTVCVRLVAHSTTNY